MRSVPIRLADRFATRIEAIILKCVLRKIPFVLVVALGLAIALPTTTARAGDTTTVAVEPPSATVVEAVAAGESQSPDLVGENNADDGVVGEQVANEVVVPDEPDTTDVEEATDLENPVDASGADQQAAEESGEADATDTGQPADDVETPSDEKGASFSDDSASMTVQSADEGLTVAATGSGSTTKSSTINKKSVYRIVSSSSDTAYMGVAGNSTASGANAEVVDSVSLIGAYWRLYPHADGSWRIINLAGTKSLAVEGTPAAGSNVRVVSGQGTSWIIATNSDGTLSFIPLGYDALRLTLEGGYTAAGTNIIVKKAGNYKSQRFSLKMSDPLSEAYSKGASLEDGVIVVSSRANGKALTIDGGSVENDANIMVSTNKGYLPQKYLLASVGNGLYELKSAISGKLVSVEGGKGSANANVCQLAKNGDLSQLWYFIKTADGKWSIRSAKSGLALNVDSADSNVTIRKFADSSNAQKFTLSRKNLFDNGQVLRLSPSHAGSMAMVVKGNKGTAGTNVILNASKSVLGQWWRVDSADGVTCKLINMLSANALKVSGTPAKDKNVYVSGGGTVWVFDVNDGGTLSICAKDVPSLCVEVEGGKKTAGSNVRIGTNKRYSSQRFTFEANNTLTQAVRKGASVAPAVYRVESALKSGAYAVVNDGSQDAGANVQIGTDSQKWELEYVANGLYRLQDANSGLYLGLPNVGTKAGTNVAQYKGTQYLNQLWFLVKNGSGYVVRSASSGRALDVKGGKGVEGANIQLLGPTTQARQTWKLVETPLLKNGAYAFSSDITYYGMLVFEVKGGSAESGANVQVRQSDGLYKQKWYLTYKGNGEYNIANKKSKLMLTVAKKSNANGGNIVQGTRSDSPYQRWILTVTPNGGIGFKNAGSGKMLEVAGGVSDNGINVQQGAEANVAYQSWHVKANHTKMPAGKLGKFVSRMIYYTDIVNVGYDQLTPDRWTIRDGGECDCSSLVINCLREAGFNTGDVKSHIGKINAGEPHDGCTYTGNMSYFLTRSGWSRLSFSLSKLRPGDILLNDAYHTCAVISGKGSTAFIAQASIDENYYGWGGKAGDQTGYETNIKKAYVYGYGWDCILRYNG